MDGAYIKRLWARADKDESGTLSESEVISLAASLNIGCTREHIVSLFKEVDVDNDGTLIMDEFKQVMN